MKAIGGEILIIVVIVHDLKEGLASSGLAKINSGLEMLGFLMPGKFYGQRSLAGYSPWGHKEWDMTEAT